MIDLVDGIVSDRRERPFVKNVEVTVEHLQRLLLGKTVDGWLNDNLVCAYFELLGERSLRQGADYAFPKSMKLKCLFLTSYLMTKIDRASINGCKWVLNYCKRIKIGGLLKREVDKVFVPICFDLHWTLAVINFKNKRLEYYDSLGGERVMNNLQMDYLRYLKTYMLWESRELNISFDWGDGWEMKNTVDSVNVPQQANMIDCGVFICKYADYGSQDLPFSFSQVDIENIRYRMFKEIEAKHVP